MYFLLSHCPQCRVFRESGPKLWEDDLWGKYFEIHILFPVSKSDLSSSKCSYCVEYVFPL